MIWCILTIRDGATWNSRLCHPKTTAKSLRGAHLCWGLGHHASNDIWHLPPAWSKILTLLGAHSDERVSYPSLSRIGGHCQNCWTKRNQRPHLYKRKAGHSATECSVPENTASNSRSSALHSLGWKGWVCASPEQPIHELAGSGPMARPSGQGLPHLRLHTSNPAPRQTDVFVGIYPQGNMALSPPTQLWPMADPLDQPTILSASSVSPEARWLLAIVSANLRGTIFETLTDCRHNRRWQFATHKQAKLHQRDSAFGCQSTAKTTVHQFWAELRPGLDPYATWAKMATGRPSSLKLKTFKFGEAARVRKCRALLLKKGNHWDSDLRRCSSPPSAASWICKSTAFRIS